MAIIEEIIGMKNPCKNCPKDIEDCAKNHSLCEKGDEYWRNASKIQLDGDINHARTTYVGCGLGPFKNAGAFFSNVMDVNLWLQCFSAESEEEE